MAILIGTDTISKMYSTDTIDTIPIVIESTVVDFLIISSICQPMLATMVLPTPQDHTIHVMKEAITDIRF